MTVQCPYSCKFFPIRAKSVTNTEKNQNHFVQFVSFYLITSYQTEFGIVHPHRYYRVCHIRCHRCFTRSRCHLALCLVLDRKLEALLMRMER